MAQTISNIKSINLSTISSSFSSPLGTQKSIQDLLILYHLIKWANKLLCPRSLDTVDRCFAPLIGKMSKSFRSERAESHRQFLPVERFHVRGHDSSTHSQGNDKNGHAFHAPTAPRQLSQNKLTILIRLLDECMMIVSPTSQCLLVLSQGKGGQVIRSICW